MIFLISIFTRELAMRLEILEREREENFAVKSGNGVFFMSSLCVMGASIALAVYLMHHR